MSSELENFIDHNLEAFDNRMPDPSVLERIQRQMENGGKKKEKAILVPMRVLLRVAACLIVLIGAAIFWIVQKETAKEITVTAAITKPAPAAPQRSEIPGPQTIIKDQAENNTATQLPATHFTSVEQDLATRKQVLFAKLNDMQSPSQRLTATSLTSQMKTADNDIVDALVKTMNTDPSTNVRLAALDALSRFYSEHYVKKQLIASLQKQKDPLVQIGLIELLTKMKETTILKELDRIVSDGNTMDAVKDHAYSSIFTLRS